MNEQLAAIKARRAAITPGVVPGPVYSQTKADATDKAHWMLMRDKPAAAIAYYAKLFDLANESDDLDKCDPDAIEAVARCVGVPIEYTEGV